MEQQAKYTFEIMSTTGVVTYQFTGDIKTSSVVSNYITDMGITDGSISLIDIGDRNMTAHEINLFYSAWQYLSGTPAGIEFASNINPEYFAEKECKLSAFLPAELNAILTPTDADFTLHKEWLAQTSTVTIDNLETNETTKQLLQFQPFITLANLANYANFLGIESMIHIFAKLIAEYSKLFIKVRKYQKK